MSTKTKIHASSSTSSPPSEPLWPTYGPLVCKWIEAMLVHGEGSRFGEPFRLRKHDKAFIYRWNEYETNDDGSFRRWRYDRALREKAKGAGKTEIVAAIALAELAGPTAPLAPNVPVSAASFEQADLPFGRAKQMATHRNSGLRPFIEAWDTEIRLKGKEGRLFRIAAQAGTNDGGLPTFAIADELHEWTGRRERLHLILTGNITKRDDAHGMCNVTTPGHDIDTVAGKLHELAVAGTDPRLLHDWTTADPNLDLSVDSQLELAVRQANPWASPDHIERLCRRFGEIPEHEFRRYHLCQWVAIPEEGWLNDKPGAVENCIGPAEFSTDDPVVMWIDMSLNRDTTSVGAVQGRSDGRYPTRNRTFDPAKSGGRIDFLEVRDHIRSEAVRLRPRAIVYDPRFLEFEGQQLLEEGLPMVEFSQSPERMSPACGRAYDLIVSGAIEFPNDAEFITHIKGAVKRSTDRGFTLSKGKSRGPIDACVGFVMGLSELEHWTADVMPAAYSLADFLEGP
jgi:hypothetical protein